MGRFINTDFHEEYSKDPDLSWRPVDVRSFIHQLDEFASNYNELYEKNTDHFVAIIDSETGIVYTGDDRGGDFLDKDVEYFIKEF